MTLTPAINQYENCLRCHGPSTGKQRLIIYGYAPIRIVSAPDPLNVIPEFAAVATSSHPVTHDRSSPLPQPSLLIDQLNQNGIASARATDRASSAALAITAMTTESLAAQDRTVRMGP